MLKSKTYSGLFLKEKVRILKILDLIGTSVDFKFFAVTLNLNTALCISFSLVARDVGILLADDWSSARIRYHLLIVLLFEKRGCCGHASFTE